MSIKVITNNVPRNLIDGYELSAKERAEFDYYRWPGIDPGHPEPWRDGEEATFFRYRGTLYDLGEFTANLRETGGTARTGDLAGWDGYMSDSFFSAIVVRLVDDNERVIVGLALS